MVNEAVGGLSPRHASEVVAGMQAVAPEELAGLLSAVADTMVRSLAGAESTDQVFMGGTANMVSAGYFNRLEEIKQVYETIEEQVVVLGMLKDTLEAGDPAVRIGGELPLVELAACSVVAASYETEQGAGGSIGVLGPTRMDYPRTLAAVQAVASSLEKALAELVD